MHRAIDVRFGIGRKGVAGFLRYYVQPGFGHAMGDFQLTWDSLSALDRWVETGTPPTAPVAVDASPKAAGRSLPLCEQPAFPRYLGKGNVNAAESYFCSRDVASRQFR